MSVRVEHWQLDVFQRGGAGEEVEPLEDETELAIANVGQCIAVEAGDVHAVDHQIVMGDEVFGPDQRFLVDRH